MSKIVSLLTSIALFSPIALLTSCASGGGGGGDGLSTQKPGRLGPLPDPAVRRAQIANEPRGDFFYGRRYHVNKTRFWGYIRKPGQPWKDSRLVMVNEDITHQPDRFSETGTGDKRYAFDHNFDYKIYGRFTGDTSYDPNSNLFLPEFKITGHQVINKQPGWIFSPNDYYDPFRVTLRAY